MVFIRNTWLPGIVMRAFLAMVFMISGIYPVPAGYSQEVFQLPQPGMMVSLSRAFVPALLKGVRVYPEDPFHLDFILDKGEGAPSSEVLKDDSARLIRYFLAALTIPEKDLWVNLSPYERDRIVPEAFGQTEMGRDLLAQDYVLKQITASVMNPKTAVGRKFWDRVYAEAHARYGTSNVPVDTLNKVWIVPEKAVIYENDRSAYVVESRLKVLQEKDYQVLEAESQSVDLYKGSEAVESAVIREVVIPVLEKEINEGVEFARLRQVYHSLILAIWFKDKVRAGLLGQAYFDQNKVSGVDIRDKAAPEKIWERYVESFRKGVYNFIKEEFDPGEGQLISRKYFSGGISAEGVRSILQRRHDTRLLSQGIAEKAFLISAVIEPVAGTLSDRAQKTVSGFWFKPREVVVRDDPEIYKGTRTSSQIHGVLRSLKEQGKKLQVRLPIRAFDGPGSGIDRKERRDVITNKGSVLLEEVPVTPTFAHRDLFLDVTVEQADDPETIVYVSPDYGYPEGSPYVVRGGSQGGASSLEMKSAPAYIFGDLFGIKGVKVTLMVSHPVILAGGVESSSASLGVYLMLASTLKGAGWSLADIYYRERDIENRVFGGAAGGQGLFAAFLGGAYENGWLSSLTDEKGVPFFGDEVFSRRIIEAEDYSFFEERMAFIQLGKGFHNGNAVDPRTAELTNIMARDLLQDQDPEAIRLYQERMMLAHQFSQALSRKDIKTAVAAVNRYMKIRDELNYRWFELALMKAGDPARPSFAHRYTQFLDQDPTLQSFRRKYGDQLKEISLYSYYSGDMIAKAEQQGIGLFMVGTGGSKMNAVAIAETPQALQQFLKENGIAPFNIKEAWDTVRTGGILKGYLPFRIGGGIEFGKEFAEYGLSLPEGPLLSRMREDQEQGRIEVVTDVIQEAETGRDIRGDIVAALKRVLGSDYNIESAGSGSIDISSGNFNKGDVVSNIINVNDHLKILLYFGNEFDDSGNDAPIALHKAIWEAKNRKLIIFSVDPDPESRTQEAREASIWIGSGSGASRRVMHEIAEAIYSGRKAVTIYGQGMDAHKSVPIDLSELQGSGLMLFDVDGTLLQRKEEDLDPGTDIGQDFLRLLAVLPMGILSGNARIMQTERITDKLKGVADISKLFLYVNSGRTLVRFDEEGKEIVEFLAPPIPREDIERIRRVIARLAVSNFGMNTREMNALKRWINFNGSYGDMTAYDSHRFSSRIRFFPWWVSPSFLPDVLTDMELKAVQESSNSYDMTEPYLIVKDGVQVTITVFPKNLRLSPDRAQQRLDPGGIDLTAERSRWITRGPEDRRLFQKSTVMLEQLRGASGIKPVIVTITPITTSMYEIFVP